MIEFIVGLFIGGAVGMIATAILTISKDDEIETRKDYISKIVEDENNINRRGDDQ